MALSFDKLWYEQLEVISDAHPKQKEIFESPKQFKVVSAGRGFGKTILLIESCIKASFNSRIKMAKAWIVAPNSGIVTDVYWNDLIARLKILNLFIRAKEREKKVWMKNNLGGETEISLKSAEAENTLIGQSIIWLGIDEMFNINQKIWTQRLEPTLRRGNGDLLIISTPNGHDYFYKLWSFGSLKSPTFNPKWKSWQCNTWDNPLYDKAYIEEAKKTLSEYEFRQQYMASFDTPAGRVYKDFDSNVHLRNDLQLDNSLPVYLSFDFNIENMSTSLCQIKSGKDSTEQDEVLYVLKTWLTHNLGIEQHCIEIIRYLEEHDYNGSIMLYGDATGGGRSASSQTSCWVQVKNAFQHYDYYAEYATSNPDIAQRINRVNSRLKNSKNQIGLYVSEEYAKELIKDFHEVAYKENGKAEVDKGRLERIGRNHTVEGLGYLIHRRFPVKQRVSTESLFDVIV